MLGDIWDAAKWVGKNVFDIGGGGDFDWKKALGKTALGVGGAYLGGKAIDGVVGTGYREPWDGFLDDRKAAYDYAKQKSQEDIPYIPGYAPKRAGLTGAEDIVKALAMANLTQGYGGQGLQNYSPLDLSKFGQAQKEVPVFEKPDFKAIMDAALAAAAQSTSAAMKPGEPPPPPEPPPQQQPPPEQPRAAPTTPEEAGDYLNDYQDKLQNEGAFGFRTGGPTPPAPQVTHDSGFRPNPLTLQDEIRMGVDHDKLEAKYGAGVVNDHFQNRGLPPPPSNSPYRGKY